MTYKRHTRWVALVALAAMVAACSGQYKGMPRAELLTWQTHATYGDLHALAVAYAENINAAVKEDTLHPGMYADYAVTLALMEHRAAANRMFNAEMRTFPESRPLVQRLKQRLVPEWVGDTLAPLRDTADLAQLMTWAYDSLAALRPLGNVASVIDSSDTAWVLQQTPVDSVRREIRLTANQKRELLVEQQAAADRARQAYADSVAAAKQAKIDARKQAQVEKEKAKRQKEKDKKASDKQKKRLEKQKQKERAAAAAERQRQKEAQAVERQRQKEAQAAERQRQKEAQAAERQRQKEAQAAERQRQKEAQAAERQRQKEAQAAERQRQKEAQAAERQRQKEAQAAERQQEKGGEQ